MDTDTKKLPNFTIHRLEHDVTGEDYAHIEFDRKGGRPRGTITERLSTVSNPKRLHELLLDAGADLPLIDSRNSQVANPMLLLPDAAGVLTASTGWKGVAPNKWFILPGWISGHRDNNRTILAHSAVEHCLAQGTAGTLEAWRDGVAGLAVKSVAASSAILVALAGPLYAFSDIQEGFIFNLAGNGSSGKSSANTAAASVWGDPKNSGSWNASTRGLIEAAAANNAGCLVLDDVEQAHLDPKLRIRKVQELIHVLTSGKSRIYAKVVSGADQLPPLDFVCPVLSSSPTSIEATLREAGAARTDGDRVRLLEYRVAHGDDGGVWTGPDRVRAPGDTRAMSDRLSASARSNFGFAGKTFVIFLISQQAGLGAKFRKHTEAFRAMIGSPTLGSVENRIAGKVALLYAAGRLAIKADVLPWSKKQLAAITIAVFREIIAASNLEAFDPLGVVLGLRTAFDDPRHYPTVTAKSIGTFNLPTGAKGCSHPSSDRLYVSLDAFSAALSASNGKTVSANHRAKIIEYLVSRGVLEVGDSGGPTKTIRFKGKKPKMLVFHGSLLNKLSTGSAKGASQGK